MILYHFSDKKIDVLKPEFFGVNSYTKKDAYFPCKRLFFYDSLLPGEYHLTGSKYRYTVKIEQHKIYNLDDDILNLKQQFDYDINKILNFISYYYLGCCYTSSFLCFCLFNNIVPQKREQYINQEYVTI